MVPLYFVSNEPFSGKSSLCVGIAKTLISRGLKVGYMKPLGTLPKRIDGITTDEDSQFIKEILGLTGDLADISPIILTQSCYREGLKSEDFSKDFLNKIEKSYHKIKKDKDVVIIEGAKSIENGSFLNISSRQICQRLSAKMILIIKYSSEIVDYVLQAKEYMGDHFAGIIINLVPKNQLEYVDDILAPFFKNKEIHVFGSIVSDEALSSVSVEELSALLGGQIIGSPDKSSEMVSSFMVGAMSETQALTFFKKQKDKAVITGGDRADIQLAALETQTKCLILTGNFQPSTVVLGRAKDLGVPIILVGYDTLTTVEKVNEIIGHVRIHEFSKIDKITELTKKYIDIEELIKLIDNK